MKPTLTLLTLLTALLLVPLAALNAADFDITKFGATPDDATDDTLAIRSAMEACGKAGGGTVVVPKGVFIVSRQKSETPILSIPSKTTVRGEGNGSVLKFEAKANASNFWRMLGSIEDCSDITIRDLHLDGANTHPGYVKGKTPEQNHGIFFYRKGGRIERVDKEQPCRVRWIGPASRKRPRDGPGPTRPAHTGPTTVSGHLANRGRSSR